VQKLGEGGFGEVWLAEHRRTKDRRVFKFCFDGDRLRSLKRELTLFRLLRDALGDRKDIARLYDVQLEEPPFFLESEFTPSGSIVEWAEARGGIDRVPIDVRIDLMARTARAVAAAHSVGILHKDIKPGNILIYEDEDGAPRPRLADFGIGAITDEGQLAGRNITVAGFTAATESGSHTGTRMYAPPETLTGRPFTVLGDIYSLGVMLYQMVVGDLDRPLASGWEQDVPGPLVREDIAVCVEGHEEQRLGSAQGLAKRLETLPERRRARRRRLAVRTAAAGSGVLAVLLLVATVWALREIGLRDAAEQERNKAQAITVVLQDMLASPDAWDEVGADVRVVEVLDGALTEFETKLDDQPEVKAALMHTLGKSYLSLDVLDRARTPLELALEIRRAELEPPHEELAQSISMWAWYHYKMGEYEVAEPLYRESLAMRRDLEERSGGDRNARLKVAESLQRLAAWENRTGRPEAAEPLYREALEIRQALLAPDDRDVGRSINNLGYCLLRQEKYDEALDHLRRALGLFVQRHGESPHPEVAGARTNVGRCLTELGRYDEARAELEVAVALKRRVWPEGNASVAVSLHYHGALLLRMDELDRAETRLREAREMRRRFLRENHHQIAETERLLATCLARVDALEEAERLLVGAYPVLLAQSATYERGREALTLLAEVCERRGRAADAQKYRDLLASDSD
jgi:serine/threonine-protein kinase